MGVSQSLLSPESAWTAAAVVGVIGIGYVATASPQSKTKSSKEKGSVSGSKGKKKRLPGSAKDSGTEDGFATTSKQSTKIPTSSTGSGQGDSKSSYAGVVKSGGIPGQFEVEEEAGWSSGAAAATKSKKKGKKKVGGASDQAQGSTTTLGKFDTPTSSVSSSAILSPPVVAPVDLGASGGTEVPKPASSAKTKQKSKSKKKKGPLGGPGSSAPLSQSITSLYTDTDGDVDEGEEWTRVESKKRSGTTTKGSGVQESSEVHLSSDSQGRAAASRAPPAGTKKAQSQSIGPKSTSATDLSQSDFTTGSLSLTDLTGATTTEESSQQDASSQPGDDDEDDEEDGEDASDKEAVEEDFVRRGSSEKRKTFAEKMLPKPRKTGVESMLEKPDYPTVARVMRISNPSTPSSSKLQPAEGFSWGDYEDAHEADGGDGDDEGWGVVDRKKKPKSGGNTSNSAGAGATPKITPKSPEQLTKKQRQNANRRAAEKAGKDQAEQERLQRLEQHKRAQMNEKIQEAYKGGSKKGNGMSMTMEGKNLVWD